MRLALRTVLSRWAMMRVVRPLASSSKARWILASVTLSRAEVASSRIRMGGFFRKIRAMEIRCFCPPERRAPPLAHVGVEALGHGHDVVVDLRPPGRLDDLVGGSPGPAVADGLHDAGGEEEHVLLHHADIPPQALLGHVPDVVAVDGDAALPHVVEPGDQVAQGGLAAAGGTHDGDGLPGLDVEGHVVEDLGVVPLVGEAHVAHVDLPPHVRQLQGVGLVPSGPARCA